MWGPNRLKCLDISDTQAFAGIAIICQKGDLAKLLSREDDSLSDQNLIWCSNFQMDNLNVSTNFRENI